MIIEALLKNDVFFKIIILGLKYYPIYLVLLLVYLVGVKNKALEIVIFIYTIIELISTFAISSICLQAIWDVIRYSDKERLIILIPFLIFFFLEFGMELVLISVSSRWTDLKQELNK